MTCFFNIILSKFFSFSKGIEVKIQLTPNDPKICTDSFDTGAAYKVKIDSVKLHIPVAQVGQLPNWKNFAWKNNILFTDTFYLQMASDAFNHYEQKLQSDVARMRFRRLVVNILSIPINTTNFESYNLFSTDVPCRLFAMFQSSKILNG